MLKKWHLTHLTGGGVMMVNMVGFYISNICDAYFSPMGWQHLIQLSQLKFSFNFDAILLLVIAYSLQQTGFVGCVWTVNITSRQIHAFH